MAKLTGPFFSLKASGQLGKTIVAFPWKGINALRTYVIPANPKTEAQRTQRGYFEDAVDAWHDSDFSALDAAAWNRFAGILAKIMSGFNAMIKTFVDEAILGNTWEKLYQVTTSENLANSFTVTLHAATGLTPPTVHWGTSKTHFPGSQDIGEIDGGNYATTIAGLTKNTLYYFYIDHGTTKVDYGRTGIYSTRTLAA
ncbi:hypothetical protein ES708_14617 [subsurface metagenome]